MTPTQSVLDQHIVDQLQAVVAANLNATRHHERRADSRFAFPYVMELLPLDQPPQEPSLIVGRHMSHGGLDFYHQLPLPFRQGVVSLEKAGGGCLRIAIDVTWCRFIRQSWYLSGGVFLRVLESPPAWKTQAGIGQENA